MDECMIIISREDRQRDDDDDDDDDDNEVYIKFSNSCVRFASIS